MKKLITLGLGLLFATTVNAQWWGSKKVKGDGNIVTKERSLGDYESVGVAGNLDVELVSGSEGKLTLVMDENLLEYVETEIKNDHLKIYVKKGYSLQPSRKSGSKNGNKILIIVPVEDISSVSLAGSGDVNTKDMVIKASGFKASVAGSGDMNLDVEADELSGSVAGSGDLRLRGKTSFFKGKVAGSGDIHGYELTSGDVEVSVAGSGDIKIHCNGNLKARVTGSGDIRYKGNPTKEDTKVVGSGDVSRG
ncbi:DUF2807 domain-containing protein [Leptobacterium flavescens]|uniref:DUF2807 domain-containing protein n=1 Tax=Leptobacterium flavescens TaxID=472055 RepID=A0A6P0ULF9_9FLAO|nr:head GIN domain-containing protein [Leptobacterium flavescens]NER14064.1 DUF2807 domain-containing protein [Leptobacterium flavescens]